MTTPEPWETLGMSRATWDRLLEAEKLGREVVFVPRWRDHLWHLVSRMFASVSRWTLRLARYCQIKAGGW